MSKVVGGKFANGAVSAIFSRLISQGLARSRQEQGIEGGSRSVVLDNQTMAGESVDLFGGKVKLNNRVSDADIEKVQSALENIFSSENGATVMEDLSVDNPLKIILNEANEVVSRHSERVITLDLDANYRYYDLSRPGSGLQEFSVERMVSHEIGHAVYHRKMVDGPNGVVNYADSIMRDINGSVRGNISNICRMQSDGNCL